MTDLVLHLGGASNGNGLPPLEPPDGYDDPPPPPTLPMVVVNGRNTSDVTKDVLFQLDLANDPPVLYVRAGQISRVRYDENRRPALELVQTDQLRHRISRTMQTVRANKDGTISKAPCAREVIADLLVDHDAWPFPPLEAITELPTLRTDGTIHHEPGYDPDTRRLHIPARGLTVPPIPDLPTQDEVAAAVQLLTEELLGDFPFEHQADLANALGLLLTPIVRPAINGQIPLALVDAPEPGTGKGLLANVANVIATGRPAAARPLAGGDDEVRKMLTAVLLEGPALIVLDNIDQAIKSPTLAAVLTTDEWSDRLLGRTETITVPNRATWIATGNNLSVGGDIGRRCYRIRLDAHQARPYTRTGFRHPDLIDWTTRHRGPLVAALLTLARAWYADGQPAPPDPATIGGFTPWSHTIAGILHHAGVTGFLDNLADLHASLDVEAQSWEAFLSALQDQFRDRKITAGEIAAEISSDYSQLRYSVPAELVDYVGRPVLARRLGEAFRRREGRRHGQEELAILSVGASRTKVLQWSVIALGQPLTPRLFDTTPRNSDTSDTPNDPAQPREGTETAGSTPRDLPENTGNAGSRGVSSSGALHRSESVTEPGETDPAQPRGPIPDPDLGLDF